MTRPATRSLFRSSAMLLVVISSACDSSSRDSTAMVALDGGSVPELQGSVGAVADLEVDHCEVAAGDVDASGTVHNSTDESADFVLRVRWVSQSDNSVLDRAVLVFEHVDAGDTVGWTATGQVPEGVEAVCSYALARGTLDD